MSGDELSAGGTDRQPKPRKVTVVSSMEIEVCWQTASIECQIRRLPSDY